jgi:hypothetical protein
LAPPIRAASFNFDVTVRFDTDHLSALATGAIPKIPLVEIRVRFCGLAAANDGCIAGAPRLKYSTCRKRSAAS